MKKVLAAMAAMFVALVPLRDMQVNRAERLDNGSVSQGAL